MAKYITENFPCFSESSAKYNPLYTPLESTLSSTISRPCWCGLTQERHIITFVPGVGLTTKLIKMDNKHSSNCNSAANSPHTERAKSEDKKSVISSDESITVVEINRDDSVKISTTNINDRNAVKEYDTLKDHAQGHENKAFVHTEETTSGSSSGSSTSSPEPPVNFELKDIKHFLTPQIEPEKTFDFDTKDLKLILPVREVSPEENETLWEPDSLLER